MKSGSLRCSTARLVLSPWGMRRIYLALKAKASEEELLALGTVLQFTPNWITSQLGPQWYPNRGIGPVPPTDPVIYRLFEVSESPRPCFSQLTLSEGCVGIRPCYKGTLDL